MQDQTRNFRRHLRLAVIVPAGAAILLAAVFTAQTLYLQRSMRKVEHSYLVQMRSRSTLKLLLDMETGLRGYLLTGEERFLQPYREAEPIVGPALEDLAGLTRDEARQRELVSQIAGNFAQWQAFSSRMIQMRKQSLPVVDVQLNLNGKQLMDNIRSARDELIQVEEARLDERLGRLRETLIGLFITVVSLSLFMGLVMATFSRRELAVVARSFDKALLTAQSRTEELHQSQAWLGAVLESIGDGLLATDERGRIMFSNTRAQQLLGANQEGLKNTLTANSIRLVDEYSREAIPDLFEGVRRDNQPLKITGHALLLRNDGKSIPVAASAFPIRGEQGQASGVVIVVRDVTEQRQSERTLQSTEKMASMGRIAATVAHEIHNPLDSMGNLLYLLQHSSLDGDSKNYVRLAQEELERVTNISEQMLTFSREAHQPVEVNISEVLDNVLTLFDARIRHMGITVNRRFDRALCIKALPGEMRQVFSNLIGNALDAMSDAGRLTIRSHASHTRNGESKPGVRVLIHDTGSGIPQEVRTRLMDPFVTSKGEKGTGLGLWVCRGILEKYHGGLRYRTSLKQGRSGTCFSVFLPATPAVVEKPSKFSTEKRAS